jgi:hypothetical protein
MTLSQALRRAAERVFDAGEHWFAALYDGRDYWDLLQIRLDYNFKMQNIALWSHADACLMLLLLAEIAEDGEAE